MITLAISSQKGGVGKTTLAINLAHAFARSGRKTLLVDSDPQGSVGLSLTRQSRHLKGYYDYLENSTLTTGEIILPTRLQTLALVPAGQSSDYDLGTDQNGPTRHRTKAFLEEVGQQGYEICLFDTAAGFFGVTAEILAAASAVLVPQQAEPLGVRSVPKMLEALGRMRVANPRLQVLGVVLTMVQKNLVESVEAAAALRRVLPAEMVMKTEVERDDLFIKASAKGIPAGVMPDGSSLLTVFGELCHELDDRMIKPVTQSR